ncbi:MAG: hypothetical protein AABY22_04260 [Nanoarchaeota archaeon]
MRTNTIRASIEGVGDIIIDTLVEEIINNNDLNQNQQGFIKNVIFRQYEEMKKRIIQEIKNTEKNQNNQTNNKKTEVETVITKRRVVEINTNED